MKERAVPIPKLRSAEAGVVSLAVSGGSPRIYAGGARLVRTHPLPRAVLLWRPHSCLADVDVAVEIPELDLLAAAVDGSTHAFIYFYFVAASLGAAVFRGLLLWRTCG